MKKRTIFFDLMIDTIDALSDECGKLLDPRIEAELTGLFEEAIAEAQLEAVEKWMAMTYDCIGNNGVISNEHFNYLAELRKAAGREE